MRRIWTPGEPADSVGSPDHFWEHPKKHPGDQPPPLWMLQPIVPKATSSHPVPGKVEDMSVSVPGAVLEWTSPFADGAHSTGTPDFLALCESTAPVTDETGWNLFFGFYHTGTATFIANTDPGDTLVDYDISSLEFYGPGTTVYWCVRYKNADGTLGPISNLASYVVP